MQTRKNALACGRRRRIQRVIAGFAASLCAAAPTFAQGSTERISLTASAGQVFSDSDQLAVSGDGRHAAFRSSGADLVPGDTNGVADVFVRDRWTGVVERVSVSSTGEEGTAESMEPHISYDGRYVVFASEANDLVLDVPAGSAKDIFLRDRWLGTTRLVTVSSMNSAANGDTHHPRVSSDGRYVSFEGSATNLVPGMSTSNYQVFRRDMSGTTALVSANLAGTSGIGFSWNGAISGDGRYVTFVSSVSNLVTADTNGQADAFWRDMLTGTTRRVSVSSSGAQGTAATWVNSSMSRDGRWVVFASSSPNLAPGEFAAGYDIFLHDTQTSETLRISLTSSGAAANQNSYDPTISDDGRYVAFQSFSTNLDPLDTDLQSDVFLRDRAMGSTKLVSRSATGGTDDDSYGASISGNGDVVGFHSESTDLVPSDTNLRIDTFVRDLGRDDHPSFCAGVASTCPCANAGLAGAGCENSTHSGGALLRAFGRASLVSDQVTLLATGLPPGSSTFFFQGTTRENGGAGISFGDGLRCAGGAVVRLANYGVVAGTAAIGYGGQDGLAGGDTTPVHTQGLVPANGGTRTYQAWYRNAAAYCTGAVHNLSNGVEILWVP
jgi:Tol biopolymer transport system component